MATNAKITATMSALARATGATMLLGVLAGSAAALHAQVPTDSEVRQLVTSALTTRPA